MTPSTRSAIPRSAVVLGILLVGAAAVLWALRGEQSVDYTLGGPLFAVDADRVTGLVVSLRGEEFRLEKDSSGYWSLGGSIADYVQQNAADDLLNTLLSAQGGPLLPGTDPEDRRYEFSGEEAIRLTLLAAGGDQWRLAIGTANPVSNLYYASGADRPACFQIKPELRQKLWRVPYDIQARNLLPEIDMDVLSRVVLNKGERVFEAVMIDDMWWLATQDEGPGYYGGLVNDYQALYTDRRRQMDGRYLVKANTDRVRRLVDEVGTAKVRRILPTEEGRPYLETWELVPPWRKLVIEGPGLNPDPSVRDTDRFEIAMGPALGSDGVPVLRRDNVLLTDQSVLATIEKPAGYLADLRAFDIRPLSANAFEMYRGDRLLISGVREGVADFGDGRRAWRMATPQDAGDADSSAVDHQLVGQMLVDLDRLPILAVLAPAEDTDVFRDEERVTLRFTWNTGQGPEQLSYDIGYVHRDRLDLDRYPLARIEGNGPEVALRYASNGCLLQVPDHVIITARNLAAMP